MPDPYAVPESRLDRGVERDGRPRIATALCVFFALGGLGALLNMLLLLTGVGTPQAADPLPASVQIARNVLTASLTLGFSLNLWRLHKRAIAFAAGIIALTVMNNAIRWLILGRSELFSLPVSVLVSIAGLGLAIAVFTYTRRLEARAILR